MRRRRGRQRQHGEKERLKEKWVDSVTVPIMTDTQEEKTVSGILKGTVNLKKTNSVIIYQSHTITFFEEQTKI